MIDLKYLNLRDHDYQVIESLSISVADCRFTLRVMNNQCTYILKLHSSSNTEAEILTAIKLPNISTVIDFGQLKLTFKCNSTLVTVSNYLLLNDLPGKSYQSILRRDFKSGLKHFPQLINIYRQLHQLNYVHGDSNLNNIIINEIDGSIYLIDFEFAFGHEYLPRPILASNYRLRYGSNHALDYRIDLDHLIVSLLQLVSFEVLSSVYSFTDGRIINLDYDDALRLVKLIEDQISS